MEDILDYEEESSNGYKKLLFLKRHELEPVLELLEKYDIVHKVHDVKHLDQIGLLPSNVDNIVNRPDYSISIPENLHESVETLMEKHPEVLYDSNAVRKLFLQQLTVDGYDSLIDVLLFPEEWMDRDGELALEILTEQGIHIPPTDYAKRRAERENIRNAPTAESLKRETYKMRLKVLGFVVMAVLVSYLFLAAIYDI